MSARLIPLLSDDAEAVFRGKTDSSERLRRDSLVHMQHPLGTNETLADSLVQIDG